MDILWRAYISLVDQGRPPRPKFLHFHAVFEKQYSNIRLAPPRPMGVGTSLSGYPGSATPFAVGGAEKFPHITSKWSNDCMCSECFWITSLFKFATYLLIQILHGVFQNKLRCLKRQSAYFYWQWLNPFIFVKQL